MPPAVAVESLVKRYAGVTAVDGVSLEVPAGTVVALLGPNGAGKTTTVECLAGYRQPDSGRVSVLGADPFEQRDAVNAVLGVMLQEAGAYQAATPREMVRLYARFYPDPLDPEDLLDQVGLRDRAMTRYRALSGGQKQRLNLALALVGRPRAVLLDEPTSGMDPHGRRRTWELIEHLRDDGVAVLLCTHALEEAERLADVVAVLDRGRLVAYDSPAALTAAAAGGRVLVTSTALFEPGELATHLGVGVAPDGPGRWRVEGDAELIPVITAWFAERGLPLSGLTTQTGLEEVFLRLTSGDEARQRRQGVPDAVRGGRR